MRDRDAVDIDKCRLSVVAERVVALRES